MGSLAGAKEYARLINHLNHSRDGRIVHRLKLSLQAAGKGFGFLGVRESKAPRCNQRGDGIGIFVSRLVNFHSD
jgi:hypothetical protein